ncbi:MAG: hypothetical protein EXR77_18965 [Myxococcales bacterium]|nr:hypothetical protein [Myxococcales bacterium]
MAWTDPVGVAEATTTTAAAITALGGDEVSSLVGTDSGLLRLKNGQLTTFQGNSAQDSDTGRVAAIATRDVGAWICAAKGLFSVHVNAIARSSVSDALPAANLTAVAATTTAGVETVWLGTKDGLFRASAGQLDRVHIPQESTKIEGIGIADGVAVVALGSGRVCEVGLQDHKVRCAEVGPVRGVASAGGEVLVIDVHHLRLRRPDGKWQAWQMQSGEIQAVSSSAAGQLLALTSLGALAWRNDAWKPLAKISGGHLIGGESSGAITTANSKVLRHYGSGLDTSFSKDIAPILLAHCTNCHRDGSAAPKHDFADFATTRSLATALVQRIALGQMPPPPLAQLTSGEKKLLDNWYSGGQLP